jgi:tetratricopeptide (TPR) repeat protein
VQGTLLEVHQTQDLLERVEAIVPDLDALYTADASRRAEFVGSPAEPILAGLDGRRTVREVIESFGTEKYQALERIATLVKRRVVVRVDPLQVEMLAWECEAAGDLERALLVYRALRRQDPGNIRILKNISGVLAGLERMEEAAAALARYAEASLREGLTEEAVRSISLAIRFDPQSIPLRELQVDALGRPGAPGALVEAYLGLADRYVAVEDHILAKNALRRILKIQPDHLAARQRLAELCGSLGEGGAAAQELSQLASLHLKRGERDDAVSLCRRAIELDAGAVEARVLLVRTLIDEGRATEARTEIEGLESALRTAGAIRGDDLPEQVTALYDRLLAIDPHCEEALEKVARAAHAAGNESRAIELEGRLVAAMAERGRIPEAIRALETMIQRVPEAFELHVQLADLYARSGESLRASAIYEFAGQGLLGAQRFGDAARVFGRLLELDPASGEAALGFARALRGRGETHRAVLRFCEAARILEEGGRDEEAASIYEEALECEPGEPECTRRAAAIHEARGHRRRAIHLYLKALKACRDRGDAPLAETFRRRVLELEPDNAVALGRPAE